VTYPQVTLATLEALYWLGTNVCEEIKGSRPDVVIGLAHSGWMPVVVAQTLWAETSKDPFPPAIRTNIGLEKNEIYTARYGKSPPAFCCGECCEGPGRLGHYLAWASEQSAWLRTLQKQIEAVLPATPKRILVVDDIFGGYRSSFLTLALLDTLYPGVDAYVHAGHTDLTDDLVTGWLEQFAPSLAAESAHNGRSSERYRNPWQKTLKPLVTGTEDITPESLEWKPIDPDSPSVKALAEHVPAGVALAAPEWIRTLACSYALQRTRGEIKNEAVVDPGEDIDHLFPRSHLALAPVERLSARAWLQGGVTQDDIAEIYGRRCEVRMAGRGNGIGCHLLPTGLVRAVDQCPSPPGENPTGDHRERLRRIPAGQSMGRSLPAGFRGQHEL
jgi:hypothetical protein